MNKFYIAYTDGSVTPQNPGHGLAAAIIKSPDGKIIDKITLNLGICTSNEAEYSAIELAVTYAYNNGIKNLRVISDSMLCVNQINNKWKINHERLKNYKNDIDIKKKYFDKITFEWVSRDFNVEADKLSKDYIKTLYEK